MRLRSLWLIFVALAAGLLTLAWLRGPQTALRPATLTPPPARLASYTDSAATSRKPVIAVWKKRRTKPTPAVADSIVAFALSLQGTNYCYAGTTPEGGFDCSGFLTYVYGTFGIDMPHSSGLQAEVGQAVPRAQARPGDLVIFTGTNSAIREPGHVGIVISQPGGVIKFVHSSSARRESGVKISQVDSTRYDDRFLGIRRVL